MTRVHTCQIEIRAPARRVFEVLSDPMVLVGSLPMVKRIEQTLDGPMRRGTRFRLFASGGEGDEIEVGGEVTDFIRRG